MNLLHICAGNLYGGIESMLLTLARSRGLRPGLGQEFAVCFDGRLSSSLTEAGLGVVRLGEVRASRPWSVLRARRRLREALTANPVDWVVCHSAWPLGLLGPAARHAGSRLALWLHDRASGKHWVERLAARVRPDFVLCNSAFTADSLPALFSDLRFGVLHCPVPAPEAFPQGTRERIRRELSTPLRDRVILIAARFEEWKGHRVLIEALARLADTRDWTCWIAGGGQRDHERAYAGRLQRDAESRGLGGRVRFLGHRDDVRALMEAADIYCQPNTGPEPFGISFIEALHVGLWVVTSDFGGAREIVTPACGALCPPGDAAAVAGELARAFQNQEHLDKTAGSARARALCDPALQLERLEQMLNDTAAPSARGGFPRD